MCFFVLCPLEYPCLFTDKKENDNEEKEEGVCLSLSVSCNFSIDNYPATISPFLLARASEAHLSVPFPCHLLQLDSVTW